jgi:hypothetical protein
LNLLISPRLLVLAVLHRVADRVAGYATESTTNCGACQRMTDDGTNDCTGTSTQSRSAKSTFLAGRKGLPRASGKN